MRPWEAEYRKETCTEKDGVHGRWHLRQSLHESAKGHGRPKEVEVHTLFIFIAMGVGGMVETVEMFLLKSTLNIKLSKVHEKIPRQVEFTINLLMEG